MTLNTKFITQKLFLNILTVCILATISLLFCMQSPLNPLKNNLYCATDSSVFKTVALYMKKGFMPYKDIFDHKGPLLYLYNWIGVELSYWRGVWYIEIFSMFVTLFAMYKICRLTCNQYGSIITLLISCTPLFRYFEGGNFTEEYALPFIAISLYIFIDFFLNHNISITRLFACGLSLGAVLMLRPNMIAVWVIFSLTVLFTLLRQKKFSNIIEFVTPFMIGVLTIIVPIIIWLALNGALSDFVYDYLIFNKEYVSGERAALINQYHSFLFFFRNVFILSSIACSVYLIFTEKNAFHAAYFLCFICTLIFICISGQTYAHYGMILIPLTAYPFSRMLYKIPNLKRFAKVCSATLCLYLLLHTISPWMHHIHSILELNGLYITETKTNEVINIINNKTTKEDYITVLGNWNIIYVLSERLSASKYSYQAPLTQVNPLIAEKYFTDLEANPPKLIIITSNYYDENSYEYQRMMDFITINKYTFLTAIEDIKIYAAD